MMEFLEDTEKRILLSAISREKKVCEQVDKESCREPYETRLTDICKSLEYKFMYDRLFKKIYEQGRADAIEEFDRICEEARSHKFGVCDADFVIDVIKAKIKEQMKEQKE